METRSGLIFVASLIWLSGVLGGMIVGSTWPARAFDHPATETTPFYPGNPSGKIVELSDPCGEKK